ncbi:MAG: DUF2520 domain-containing protein [Prevotella sp.]|nr:DUF2520 domain-containing protein [Prevotella sp.]
MKIVLIGAGRLATNLGKALHEAGHCVAQVFSRTQASASALASMLQCETVCRLSEVITDADVYIVALKDDAMPVLLPDICSGKGEAVVLHTAGSVPVDVFKPYARHYGVLYPMQTFSKEKAVNFSEIPCFVEANDEQARQTVRQLAESISSSVYELSSADRRYLHLAAVFACNFTNHCYALSADILSKHGVPFEVMLPLIDETASKVHVLSPMDAQTGPAVRYDEQIIKAQAELLNDDPPVKELYELMSRSINRKMKKGE